LLAYIVIGWIAAFGIDFLLHWMDSKRNWEKAIIGIVIFSIPIVQIIFNWKRVDETENRLPQQFVTNTFSHLEPNAVVLATEWDYFISPSLYYQFIRNERRDITVIDKSLLQNRSWYFLHLENYSPWLMQRINTSANLFLTELDKFEHDLPFYSNIIQANWQNLLNQIVEQSLPDHPVYIDIRIDQEFSPTYQRTPAGLFVRLTKLEDTACYRTAFAPFNPWDIRQPVAENFEQYYVSMLMRDADWLLRHRRADGAKTVLAEVLRIEPGNISATWLMTRAEK
jgi:hypothetical protein